MGLSENVVGFIDENIVAYLSPSSRKRMLELGNQGILGDFAPERTGKEYYENRGFEHVSVDLNGKDGAVRADLSKPFRRKDWRGRFDVVTNAGTSEHVEPLMGQYHCFRNIHESLCAGGLAIHAVPAAEQLLERGAWQGHCNNYYSEAFFRLLADRNGYAVLAMRVWNGLHCVCLRRDTDQSFMDDPDELLGAIERRQGGRVYLNINDSRIRYTSFPGVDIAFIRSVSELAGEEMVVAADPPVHPCWKKNLRAAVRGKGGIPPRPGRITRRDRGFLSGYVFRGAPPCRRLHGRPVFPADHKLPDRTVVLLSATRWERDLIFYYERGFRRFAALPRRDLTTGWRRVIVGREHRCIFLPNFKVMYSSFQAFMRHEFPEFKDRQDAADELYTTENLLLPAWAGHYRFSIVRNPWDRLTSAFRDKLGRGAEHENYHTYRQPIGAIMDCGPDVSFETLVRYVVRIPDSHTNQHWLSQYANLYAGNTMLVDYVGRFESLDESLRELHRATGIRWSPGHVHRTGAKGSRYHDYYTSDEIVGLVQKHYRRDVETFEYAF